MNDEDSCKASTQKELNPCFNNDFIKMGLPKTQMQKMQSVEKKVIIKMPISIMYLTSF